MSKVFSCRSLKLCRKSLSSILSNFTRNSSMSSVQVEINEKTGYATVSLNRQPVNILNAEFMREITKTLKDLEDNRTRGVILTSTSPTVFSSGLDVSVLAHGDEKSVRELWTEAQESFLALYGSSYPVAAALNGHTIAGGCYYALCAEYRVMVADHKIGIHAVKVGLATPRIIIEVMKEVLPFRIAEQALLEGKIYSTEEALKIGLIDEIASDKNDAIAKCEKYLERFNSIPLQARSNTKKIVRNNLLEYVKNNREKDLEEFVESVMNEEARSAVKSYLDELKNKKS